MSLVGVPRRRRRVRVWAVIVAVLLTVLVPAGLAYALFSAQAATAGGVIVSGNLDLAPDATSGSAVRWVETTAAVPVAERRSGADLGSLASYRGVPGDTVEVRYAVSSTLVGDNISAVIRASLGAPASPLPAGLSVTGYRVLSPAGAVLAPAVGLTAMGQTTVLPQLTGTGDDQLVIAVQLAWTGSISSLTYTSDLTGTEPAVLTTIPISISLEQVRAGAGFVP